QALEWADSIGVDIVSSSLGYLRFDDGFTYTPADLNGHVAVTTVAAESAAAHGMLVVTAAGNDGPGFRTLVTPGDADSGIPVRSATRSPRTRPIGPHRTACGAGAVPTWPPARCSRRASCPSRPPGRYWRRSRRTSRGR